MSRKVSSGGPTPAIQMLEGLGIPFTRHPYEHDPKIRAFGDEAVSALGVTSGSVFKTLVVRLDTGRYAVAVLPVAWQGDLKAIAAACGAKKARLASEADVTRLTGYVIGGVSPLGQRTALPTVIDASAPALPKVYVSGGRRGFDVALAPADLRDAPGATFAPITRA